MTSRPAWLLSLTIGSALATASFAAETVLVQFGSPMTYRANRTNPGIGLAWTAENFDDSVWANGTYGVGYELNPPGATALIQTAVSRGTFSVYSRSQFTIADVSQIVAVTIAADYDDGFVAWINGTEVFRSSEMPAGPPAWNTNSAPHESSNGAVPNYGPPRDVTAAALAVLHDGVNVLAIGVWNSAAAVSSDLVLVPRLSVTDALSVTRGPYLQMETPTSVVVRWRTDSSSDSCVRYGPNVSNLSTLACAPGPTAEHVVTVSGLSPNTRYTYSVGTAEAPLVGGDASHFFDTSPPPGEAIPTRVWVLGDSGTANANASAVRDAYAAFGAGTRTNLILMLGDNAYLSGTDAEYQAAVFDMYGAFLRNTVLWPTLGNHDGVSADSVTQSGPYYDNFTLPRNGEAGGLATGTEAYYAFDYGNIHFICLDSFESDRSPGGAMMTWLQQDALATTQQWIVAFWHHPPYSKGSHDSDAEAELIDMRQYALPILEQAGVDLVLAGHSHSYERSFLIDGHYGPSTTFDGTMVKDGGDGRVGGTGAYKKLPIGPAAHQGEVHIVAGSSGQVSGGALNHPAMFLSLSQLGSVVLDVDGRRLDAKFIQASGAVGDTFTIFKGPPPAADFSASVTAGNAPLAVEFTDLSAGDPTSWAWELDGQPGADSTQQNSSHMYTEAGIYTVSLTASNLAGADTETKQQLVCVAAANDLADTDGDGIVDTCDPDDDDDGVADALDCAPFDVTHSAPPGDVGMSMVLGPARETIGWTGVPEATFFNLYRGEIAGVGFAYNHSCRESHLLEPAASDTESPAVGSLFYYLASAANSCAEGPLGFDSTGSPRPNPSPCP